MGDVFDERSERASGNEELLSVTISNGVIRQIDSEKRNIASEDKSNYKVVKKGDVPYNSMRMWQGAVGTSDYDGIVSPAYTVLIPKNNCNGKFFMELFKKQPTLEIFKRWSQGLTSDTWNLKYPVLSTIPFMVPSVKEQEKIAEYFKSLDNLITLHQRKCEQTKELKKFMLQKMFPKKGEKNPEIRFPGFTDDWEERKLEEISDKVTEKNKNSEFVETLTNSAEFGIINQRDFFDKNISNEKNLNGYYIVREDDFVYNPRISNYAPVGPIKRNKLGRTGVMSPLYYVFRPYNIDKKFLEYYFDTTVWHKFMKINGDSGVRADRFAIKDSIFKTMPIPYPSIEEQRKIGKFFDNLNDIIALHQREVFYTLKHIFYRCCDTLLSGGL